MWQVHLFPFCIYYLQLYCFLAYGKQNIHREKSTNLSQRVYELVNKDDCYHVFLDFLPHGCLLLCHFVVCTIDIKLAGHDS